MREQFATLLRRYADNAATLTEVEDWTVAHVQPVLAVGDAELVAAINEIEGLLVEYHANLAIESEIFSAATRHARILDTVRTETIDDPSAPDGRPVTTVGAGNSDMTESMEYTRTNVTHLRHQFA